LKRWAAFARFLDDGRICRSNAAAERAVRGIVIGRGSWTFAATDAGGRGRPWSPRRSRSANQTTPIDRPGSPKFSRGRGIVPRSGATNGRHGIGLRAGRQSRKRLEPRRRRPSENTCGAGRIDPTDSSIANRMMLESPNAGASLKERAHPRLQLWSSAGKGDRF
jgi:hypothetical protein